MIYDTRKLSLKKCFHTYGPPCTGLIYLKIQATCSNTQSNKGHIKYATYIFIGGGIGGGYTPPRENFSLLYPP